ncbi:MAG: FecR domain-containing protein, partial [Chloroflexota bacterium]
MKTIMHRVAGVLVLLAVVVPAVSGQPDEIAATLMVLAPNVQYQRSNTDEPLFISQETIIGAGDTIRTAHSGRARIVLFGDGSRIDLESDSTLTIDRLEADEDTFDVALTLVNGETRHRVLREAGDGWLAYLHRVAETGDPLWFAANDPTPVTLGRMRSRTRLWDGST